MTRLPNYLLMLPMLAFVLALAACKDGQTPKEYDRSALVSNIADNVIVPNYAAWDAACGEMVQSQASFRRSPSIGSLDSLQASFLAAWLAWKPCSPYEFGPAAAVTLRTAVNTFPTDSSQILLNINSGNWDLNAVSNLDARGFPALDYVLHGTGSDDNSILARYLVPADSAKLQSYLAALVADVSALASQVHTTWTGSYATTFKASLGTDVGSSTSLLVNELNRDLEVIKHASIGIPLGKQTFDQPLPEKVEGLHCLQSEALALAQLSGIEALVLGKRPGGTDGYGLLEAITAVEVEYNGTPLETAIRNQFAAAKSALEGMPDPLAVAVVGNRPPVELAYTEIQKLVILLKADMASALSILITYTDADGD